MLIIQANRVSYVISESYIILCYTYFHFPYRLVGHIWPMTQLLHSRIDVNFSLFSQKMNFLSRKVIEWISYRIVIIPSSLQIIASLFDECEQPHCSSLGPYDGADQ